MSVSLTHKFLVVYCIHRFQTPATRRPSSPGEVLLTCNLLYFAADGNAGTHLITATDFKSYNA